MKKFLLALFPCLFLCSFAFAQEKMQSLGTLLLENSNGLKFDYEIDNVDEIIVGAHFDKMATVPEDSCRVEIWTAPTYGVLDAGGGIQHPGLIWEDDGVNVWKETHISTDTILAKRLRLIIYTKGSGTTTDTSTVNPWLLRRINP